MLFEQIKEESLHFSQNKKMSLTHNCKLAPDTGNSQTLSMVAFILAVLHTVVVISAFIWCQCLAIHTKLKHIQFVCHYMSFARRKLQTKSCVLYYRIHIEFACSEACSLCHPCALCY